MSAGVELRGPASTRAALRARLQAAESGVNALSLRERALLLAISLAVPLLLGKLLLLEPLRRQTALLHGEVAAVQERLEGLARQEAEILRAHESDPDAELRSRLAGLAPQIQALDLRIREHTVSMIPPREMAAVVERMLPREGLLRLTRLENLEPQPLLPAADPSGSEGASSVNVYRHEVVLEIRGPYLETLAYLVELESLPWEFLWESLEYRVDGHPEGVTTIRASTLGAQEEWLGV